MADALKIAYIEARDAYNGAAADSEQKASLESAYKKAKKAYKRAKHTQKDGVAADMAPQPNHESEAHEGSDIRGSESLAVSKRKRKRKRKRKQKIGEADDATPINGPGNTSVKPMNQSVSLSNKLETAVCTVFVGGISYDANEDDLREFFADCGTITSVRMPRYQDSGKPRGYAHVDFSSEEGVEKALSLDKSRMLGRYLDIKMANRRRHGGDFDVSERPAGCRTVFVKNLPYDTKEGEVFEAFQFCGKIAEVRLVRWGHTNKLKGIGYVQFEKEESAVIAVKKRGEIRVGGRSVQIDFEGGAPKASFRDADGSSWKKNSFSNRSKRQRRAGPSF